jgi:hypothetical protein
VNINIEHVPRYNIVYKPWILRRTQVSLGQVGTNTMEMFWILRKSIVVTQRRDIILFYKVDYSGNLKNRGQNIDYDHIN